MIAQKTLVCGILFLTGSFWLSPFVYWFSEQVWKSRGAVRKTHYDYFHAAVQSELTIYSLGIFITCLAGVLLAFNRYQHDPREFITTNYRQWKTPTFVAQRLLAVGVLFLMAPAWCFPFINDMAISIAGTKVGYQSFLIFDTNCIMLQYETFRILYNTGVVVTCLAVFLFVWAQVRAQRKAALAAKLTK